MTDTNDAFPTLSELSSPANPLDEAESDDQHLLTIEEGRSAQRWNEDRITPLGPTQARQGGPTLDEIIADPNAKPGHPLARIFHVVFKGAALAIYLTASILKWDFIKAFIVIILLLAADFWTVKNISGRLLVGLRWWNDIKPDGTSTWVFESAPKNRHIDSSDSRVFWLGLYLTPIIWIVLGVSALFTPLWLLVDIIALLMSGANTWGYWKCSKDSKKRLQQFIASQL
jgi:hypothetical protein